MSKFVDREREQALLLTPDLRDCSDRVGLEGTEKLGRCHVFTVESVFLGVLIHVRFFP